jgi:hypothetical protein
LVTHLDFEAEDIPLVVATFKAFFADRLLEIK